MHIIRPAIYADIQAVSDIFTVLDTVSVPNYLQSSDHAYIQKIIDHNDLYVISNGQTILGAFAYRIEEMSCELVSIATHHQHRGSGIGKIIIDHLVAICHEQRIPKIRCRSADFLHAQGFYTRMGFQEQHLLRKQFYGLDIWYFGLYIKI